MIDLDTTLGLFPFSILFDSQMEICALGRTLHPRCEQYLGGTLGDLIRMVRTRGPADEALKPTPGRMVQFAIDEVELQFKGEFVKVSGDRWLLIGTPQIRDTKQLRAHGFSFQDFANFDTTIDNLYLVGAAKRSGREALQTALQLRNSEEQYRRILEHELLIVATFDVDGVIEFGNPAWQRLAGGDSVGTPILRYLDAQSSERVSALMRAVKMDPSESESGTHTSTVELEGQEVEDFGLLDHTGKEIVAQGSTGCFERADGTTSLFVLLTDVTAQRAAAQVLEQARARLVSSQKMNALGCLAGGIAHDFNNLLGVIMSASCIMLEDLPEEDPLREDAEMILRSCESGAKLSSQLMSLSRNKRAKPTTINLSEAVFDLSQVLDTVVGEHIRLRFSSENPQLKIEFDRSELEQILINTCVNAKEAMPDGGTVTIRVSQPSPGVVQLSIEDDGVGMHDEITDRIFEPFFSTKSNDKNPGLGLSVVYKIADRSGAEVFAESVPNVGTKIHINFDASTKPLPRASARSANSPFERLDEINRGTPPRVLLIEDREELRRANARSLRRVGCRVTAVEGVQQAAEVLEAWEGPPDVLVTDVQLEDGNGADFAADYMERGLLRRVVLVTGYARKEHLDRVAQQYGWNILMKPFTPSELTEELARTLRSH